MSLSSSFNKNKGKAVLMTNSLFSVPPAFNDGAVRAETLTCRDNSGDVSVRAETYLERYAICDPLFAAANPSKLGDASSKPAKPENTEQAAAT